MALAFTLYAFAAAALWAHVMPAFASKGLSQSEALAVVVWIGPAQVAGRLVYAAVGRAWSLRVLGAVVLLGLPLALTLFALARSLWVLWLFAAVFGAANGLITIVRGGLIPETFGRAHVGRIGGAMSAIGLLARAAAPVAAAALLLALGGYRELLLLLAASAWWRWCRSGPQRRAALTPPTLSWVSSAPCHRRTRHPCHRLRRSCRCRCASYCN